VLGAAVLLETASAGDAQQTLSPARFAAIEVHQWDFGGRPT